VCQPGKKPFCPENTTHSAECLCLEAQLLRDVAQEMHDRKNRLSASRCQSTGNARSLTWKFWSGDRANGFIFAPDSPSRRKNRIGLPRAIAQYPSMLARVLSAALSAAASWAKAEAFPVEVEVNSSWRIRSSCQLC